MYLEKVNLKLTFCKLINAQMFQYVSLHMPRMFADEVINSKTEEHAECSDSTTVFSETHFDTVRPKRRPNKLARNYIFLEKHTCSKGSMTRLLVLFPLIYFLLTQQTKRPFSANSSEARSSLQCIREQHYQTHINGCSFRCSFPIQVLEMSL